jgi:hypothetical protein
MYVWACVIFPSGIPSIIQLANGVDRAGGGGGGGKKTGFAKSGNAVVFLLELFQGKSTRFFI